MSTIHLIGGEKGGVGKSVVARLLAQYMIDHEIPFIGFDTDRSMVRCCVFTLIMPHLRLSTITKVWIPL